MLDGPVTQDGVEGESVWRQGQQEAGPGQVGGEVGRRPDPLPPP